MDPNSNEPHFHTKEALIVTDHHDKVSVDTDLDQLIFVVKTLHLRPEPAIYIVHLKTCQLVMKVDAGNEWVFELLVFGHLFPMEHTSDAMITLKWTPYPEKSSGMDGHILVYRSKQESLSFNL